MGSYLSNRSSRLRNWLTKSTFFGGFKIVLWTGIKCTLTFLRFGYLLCLQPHSEHVCRPSAAPGACCHHFSLLACCLQTAKMPFPHQRQGTVQGWESHPAGTTPGPSPDPHSQVGATFLWAALGPWLSQRGYGTQESSAETCAPQPLGKPLYFAINELRGPLMSW